MANFTALFWDVGGVLLTDSWNKPARRRAVENFKLDWEEFEDRHELVSTALDIGQLLLDAYLERTVFYRSRAFTLQEFKDFMFAQSKSNPETLGIVERLACSKKYLLGTINNESLDLNLYRVNHFGLQNYFTVFFSSCFLGVKKPDEAIYRLALQMTQRPPEECLFTDDRALNLECARRLGMRTIHYQNPAQLMRELCEAGVEI